MSRRTSSKDESDGHDRDAQKSLLERILREWDKLEGYDIQCA